MSFLIFLALLVVGVTSAPTTEPPNTTTEKEVEKPQQEQSDLSQFDEVHDQRQNGTANVRVNLEKILMMWVPPSSLLTAALLVDRQLLEEFNLNEEKPEKPQVTVVLGPEVSTKEPEGGSSTQTAVEITSKAPAPAARRRLMFPGLLRPLALMRRNSVRS